MEFPVNVHTLNQRNVLGKINASGKAVAPRVENPIRRTRLLLKYVWHVELVI